MALVSNADWDFAENDRIRCLRRNIFVSFIDNEAMQMICVGLVVNKIGL